MDWLKRVDPGEASSAASVVHPTEQGKWIPVGTLNTRHRYTDKPRDSGLRFSVGESGSIGISFVRMNPNESKLSLVDPTNPHKLVTVSSGNKVFYFNPVIIKLHARDYLAVHCHNDASIHLWDTQRRTPRVVCREGSRMSKSMVMCAKDNDTVIYGEYKCKDGMHNVYLLNTSTEQWTLRTTLRLQTGLEAIVDMCFVQQTDGTACLVLCNSFGPTRSVMAVAMLSGNVQWRLGPEKMGEGFHPYSVCADRDYNVYVCDTGHHRVYVLSPEDGSMISTVLNAQQHGIIFPFCIQIEEHRERGLYVSHVNNLKDKKWVISKFLRK